MRPAHLTDPESAAIASIDGARNPRPRLVRPALTELEAAFDRAIAEDGPGAVFRIASRRIQDLCAPAIKGSAKPATGKVLYLRKAEALFKGGEGER